MASLAGKEGFAKLAPYSAASAGVIAFAKAPGREIAGAGIFVNCVAPGPIDTDMIRDLGSEEVKAIVGCMKRRETRMRTLPRWSRCCKKPGDAWRNRRPAK